MVESALRRRADEPSATIGAYRTLRLLGRGGMGTVYEGEHANGQRVAIKVVNGSLAGDSTANERFLREARAIATVRHPHIVRLLDMGVDAGQPFLAMELLEGEPLDALLSREKRLPLARVIQTFLPLLSAVSAIHAAGIVHRDLKLANVFLARRRQGRVDPVVLDFGISRIEELTEDASLTRSAGILGTPRYLSPEQVMNAKDASSLSDQYALGVMLYECATGQRPFSGGSPYEVMHAILTQELTRPSAHVPELPAEFDAIVLRALNRDARARFPDVRALGSALLALGESSDWRAFAREFIGEPSQGSEERTEVDSRVSVGSPSWVASPAPESRPRRGRLLAALVAAGSASAAVAFSTYGSQPEPEDARSTPVMSSVAAATSKTTSHEPRAVAAAPDGAAPPAPVAAPAPTWPRPVPRAAPKTARPTVRGVSSALPKASASSPSPRRSQTPILVPGEDDAIDPFAPSSN